MIAAEDESQWRAMCAAMGHDEWATDRNFADLASRLAHRHELDALITEWTELQTPHQVMIKLQRVGVAAGVVANSEDLYLDPHMLERGFTKEVWHAEYGRMTQVGRTVSLSETPGPALSPAPEIGADNREVFGRMLGLTEDQLNDLQARGIFG